MLRTWTFVLSCLGVACSGTGVTVQDNTSDSGNLSDSGAHDGGSVDSGSGATPCPSTVPPSRGACSKNGLVCEYGDDPRAGCRSRAMCSSGSWNVTLPRCVPLATQCPATRDAAQGQTCSPDQAVCAYDRLGCTCTNCVDGPVIRCQGPLTWHCTAPNADAQCPAAVPNLGTPCATEGKQCTYSCDSGTQCTNGIWTPYQPPGGCPVSTRRAKKDIRYLDQNEVAALAKGVLSTRLATYEYVDRSVSGKRRLGFILEDRPDSFASDAEHSQVDLYGYVSELVAAVKTQDEEIRSLKKEVVELKKQRGESGGSRRR